MESSWSALYQTAVLAVSGLPAYFAIAGVVLAVFGVILFVKGLTGLATGKPKSALHAQGAYTSPAQYPQQYPQYPQQPYAQPQATQQSYEQIQYPRQ